MGSAYSCQKAQNQGNFSNDGPLLVRSRSYCECDDNHCEEPVNQAPKNDQTITDDPGPDLDIMLCPDLASCATEMELERQENGSQWPAYERLHDNTEVDHEQPLAPSLSLHRLNDLYEDYIQKWESSEACRISRTVFQDVLNKKTTTPIDICMCLGLGSFSGETFSGKSEENENPWDVPMSQFVAFENWVAMINAHQGNKPRVFFQDPDFNALDREFLTGKGCIVIDTPNSNEVTTPETFLFTPGACYSVVYASLHQVFPALYLGIDFDKETDCRFRGYAVWKMLMDFLARRDKAYMAISSVHRDHEKELAQYGSSDCFPEQDWEIVYPLYYTSRTSTGQ